MNKTILPRHIVLIRHGEYGGSNSSLTENGIKTITRNAHQILRKVPKEYCIHIRTSQITRAKESGIIFQELCNSEARQHTFGTSRLAHEKKHGKYLALDEFSDVDEEANIDVQRCIILVTHQPVLEEFTKNFHRTYKSEYTTNYCYNYFNYGSYIHIDTLKKNFFIKE